nr:MAG TPA: hypothetical protein [Caudoviricetes sp.]
MGAHCCGWRCRVVVRINRAYVHHQLSHALTPRRDNPTAIPTRGYSHEELKRIDRSRKAEQQ